jgi:hypothetical protein
MHKTSIDANKHRSSTDAKMHKEEAQRQEVKRSVQFKTQKGAPKYAEGLKVMASWDPPYSKNNLQ